MSLSTLNPPTATMSTYYRSLLVLYVAHFSEYSRLAEYILVPNLPHEAFANFEIIAFWSLPLEIRDMIYELLLVKDNPIPILSPRKKNVINEEFTSKHFSCLLRVNKRFNAEASKMFYSKNRWVVGHGHWHSTRWTNEHALKEFNRRVPGQNRACIKEVYLEISYSNVYSQ
jgi:hypothetical protein